jgi:hypothetical protein
MKKRHAILAVAMVAGLRSAAWAQGMKGHEGMDMNMDKMMPAPPDTAATKDLRPMMTVVPIVAGRTSGNLFSDGLFHLAPSNPGKAESTT